MSKGDHRRPRAVDIKTFAEAWDQIFGSGSDGHTDPVQTTESEYRPSTNASAEGSEFEPNVPGEN